MTSPIKSWRNLKKLSFYLNQEGKLLVWTKIYTAPLGFEQQTPYLVGLILLQSGEKVTAELVDCQEEELNLNQRVKVIIRRVGKAKPDEVIEYGIKVKPL